ncbi:APC family permease [Ktedonobacter racemifer]|uniref:Amino acid permease-associated region n=1 Tax=Ktedonobacter racemifer DSM 44963 TaxID=485913 RepID=D6TQ62_KTERA|nr:APC family permease [Ktedonobacter racemifer]EFH85710.1 amino acid permease-associated region [Ktedonobacter racemifer DSM 44963]
MHSLTTAPPEALAEQATAEMPTLPEEGQGLLPSASLASKHLLPRTLRTRDLLIFCLIAVLLVTNIPLVAGAGGASIIYWIIGFLTFLLPSALVAGQLFRLFPGEACIYQWFHLAFGNFWDSFLGFFCNWWPGAIGLTVEAGAVVSSLQLLNASWFQLPWQQGLVELVVLFVAQLLCWLPHRLFQQMLYVIFPCYLGMMLLLGGSGLVWLATGHPIQGNLSTQSWHIGSENYPVFATVIVALLGVAIPLNMGVEMKHRHAGNRALLYGTCIIMIGYLVATFGILVVVPPQDLGNPAFMTEIFERVFGSGPGHLLGVFNALVLIGYFLCATAVYNQLFSRFLLVASLDRRLPSWFSRLSPQGVPYHALWFQTGINTLFIACLFFLAPAFAPTNQQFSLAIFLVVMNGASVVWNAAMIGLFVAGMILFLRYRRELHACALVAPWVLHLAAIAGIGASLVAIWSAFFAGSPVPTTLNSQEWGFWVLLIVLTSMALGALYSYMMPESEDLASLLSTQRSSS